MWGRRQSWDYDDRFEELDTDEDGLQGVELDQGMRQKRFVSDELQFTGIDLGGGGTRQRRLQNTYDDEFPASTDDDYDGSTGLIRRPNMQLMYREKEDLLVERALERIARARALGKTDVKLSQAEIDALGRLDGHRPPRRPSPIPAPSSILKSKKPLATKPKTTDRKKPSKGDKSGSSSPRVKTIENRPRNRSTVSDRSRRESRDDALVTYPTLQESSAGFARGYQQHAPPGYYNSGGPSNQRQSQSGSRSNSSQSLKQSQPQFAPPYQHPYQQNRYYSNPDSIYNARPGPNTSRQSRPDPSDPDWEPRARSNSSLVNMPLDQLPYQVGVSKAPRFEPSDPRFASPSSSRRVVSVPIQSSYRRQQDELFLPPSLAQQDQPEVMQYLASSDDEDQQDEEDDEDEDDDDDDEDTDDQGVQVNVQEKPTGGYTIQTRSGVAPKSNVAGKGKATRKGR